MSKQNFYERTQLHKKPPAPTETVDIRTHAKDSCTLETVEGMKERLANQAKQILELKETIKNNNDIYNVVVKECKELTDIYFSEHESKLEFEGKLNDYIRWLEEQKAKTAKYKHLAQCYKQLANSVDDGLD